MHAVLMGWCALSFTGYSRRVESHDMPGKFKWEFSTAATRMMMQFKTQFADLFRGCVNVQMHTPGAATPARARGYSWSTSARSGNVHCSRFWCRFFGMLS